MQQVKAVFPYGSVHVEVVDGGLRASSGIAIAELGARRRKASARRRRQRTWMHSCLLASACLPTIGSVRDL